MAISRQQYKRVPAGLSRDDIAVAVAIKIAGAQELRSAWDIERARGDKERRLYVFRRRRQTGLCARLCAMRAGAP